MLFYLLVSECPSLGMRKNNTMMELFLLLQWNQSFDLIKKRYTCVSVVLHPSMRAWKLNNFFEVLFLQVVRTFVFVAFFSRFFFYRLMPHGKVFRYKKVQFSRKEGRKSSPHNCKITQKKGHFVVYYWKKKPLLTCVQEVWTTTTKQRWSFSSKNKSWKEKKRFEFYFLFLPQCCWWSAKLCKHFLSGEFWRSK